MGEKIPEEEFKTRAEENVMDVLTQYKKKMRRLLVTMMVIFYVTAIFVSLCLSNRLVTEPYMNMGNVIAETATDKASELYRTCLNSALDGREGRTGFEPRWKFEPQ